MTACEKPSDVLTQPSDEAREIELIDLQFKVARRADALARRWGNPDPAFDRQLWLRAEWEIFDRTDRFQDNTVP